MVPTSESGRIGKALHVTEVPLKHSATLLPEDGYWPQFASDVLAECGLALFEPTNYSIQPTLRRALAMRSVVPAVIRPSARCS